MFMRTSPKTWEDKFLGIPFVASIRDKSQKEKPRIRLGCTSRSAFSQAPRKLFLVVARLQPPEVNVEGVQQYFRSPSLTVLVTLGFAQNHFHFYFHVMAYTDTAENHFGSGLKKTRPFRFLLLKGVVLDWFMVSSCLFWSFAMSFVFSINLSWLGEGVLCAVSP